MSRRYTSDLTEDTSDLTRLLAGQLRSERILTKRELIELCIAEQTLTEKLRLLESELENDLQSLQTGSTRIQDIRIEEKKLVQKITRFSVTTQSVNKGETTKAELIQIILDKRLELANIREELSIVTTRLENGLMFRNQHGNVHRRETKYTIEPQRVTEEKRKKSRFNVRTVLELHEPQPSDTKEETENQGRDRFRVTKVVEKPRTQPSPAPEPQPLHVDVRTEDLGNRKFASYL